MLDLGVEYVVGDMPGFTDADALHQQLVYQGLTVSALKIFVTSVSSLRDGRQDDLIKLMDGATILPVVRYDPPNVGNGEKSVEPGDADRADVRRALARWRGNAPKSAFLDPCYMPDKDKVRVDSSTQESVDPESAAIDFVRSQLATLLSKGLAEPSRNELALACQIETRRIDAEQKIAQLLDPIRPRFDNLKRRQFGLIERLQTMLLDAMIGDELYLRAGLRQKLRAVWFDGTPQVCFPYRTFCGILLLTAGAWDRLVMSFAGSLPSLAATFFQTVKNVRQAAQFAKSLRAGLRKRIEMTLEAAIRPQLRELSHALDRVLPAGAADAQPQTARQWSLEVAGVEQVEQRSRTLFQNAVGQFSSSPRTATMCAVVATSMFVALLSGPVIAVYKNYFVACIQAFRGVESALQAFPTPPLAMFATSLVLSAAPVLVLAMIGVWHSCRNLVVQKCVESVRSSHETMIRECIRNETLRVAVSDPRLDAAVFLFSIGRHGARSDADGLGGSVPVDATASAPVDVDPSRAE